MCRQSRVQRLQARRKDSPVVAPVVELGKEGEVRS